jgi:AraC-like DNA-binding protein
VSADAAPVQAPQPEPKALSLVKRNWQTSDLAELPMHARFHVPFPPLSQFVEYVWFQQGSAPSHPLERIVPSGTSELVIALDDAPLRTAGREGGVLESVGSALFCGAQSAPFVIDTQTRTPLIGVHFKPGGAFPFFAPPAVELRNARVGLRDLWGGAAAVLCEQLAAAPTAAARFALLEGSLLARAGRPLARHPAVTYGLGALDSAEGAVTVAAVTEKTGLSRRRFIELFDREVGLTPKLFARVRRLQAVLRRLEDPAGPGWAEVALAHGYFDQAHLIRDFRQFTGLSPTAYLAQRGAALNHVALPARG